MNHEIENILNKKDTPIFYKILPKQVVYKEENGEPSEAPYRLGRLDTELYRNKKVINTIYGKDAFVPKITIYVNVVNDDKGYILINILNAETNTCVKQIMIRSQHNNMSLDSLKELYDEIITLINDKTKLVIDLITLLRDKDIEIEEYC